MAEVEGGFTPTSPNLALKHIHDARRTPRADMASIR